MKIIKNSTLLLLCYCLSACIPINPYERMAVGITNKSTMPFEYRVRMNESPGEFTSLATNETDYFTEYDDYRKNFSVPKSIHEIEFRRPNRSCLLTINDRNRGEIGRAHV